MQGMLAWLGPLLNCFQGYEKPDSGFVGLASLMTGWEYSSTLILGVGTVTFLIDQRKCSFRMVSPCPGDTGKPRWTVNPLKRSNG